MYYVQATHARQCCPLYLYLYVCSSDHTVHEPCGAWVLPRSTPAKKRVLDINDCPVSKAPSACTCHMKILCMCESVSRTGVRQPPGATPAAVVGQDDLARLDQADLVRQGGLR